MKLQLILLWATMSLLSACGSIQVEDYQANTPLLIPEQFFNGPLTAHGVVKNRSGKVIRRFNADIDAHWRNGVGTLNERFIFDDGEHQQRIWTLAPNGSNQFIGTAGDVIGPGNIRIAGNSMFLDYVLRIAYGDGSLDLHIDDRMYLVSDNVMINESVMTKWGFKVGSLLLVIQKKP